MSKRNADFQDFDFRDVNNPLVQIEPSKIHLNPLTASSYHNLCAGYHYDKNEVEYLWSLRSQFLFRDMTI